MDDGKRHDVWWRALALAAMVVAAGLMLPPAIRDSQTTDEAVYVVAGLSYWRTGDFRLNVEHPPLLKLLFALPLLARRATFTPVAVDWQGASEWDVAPKVLYQNVVSGLQLLADARTVNVLLTVALIALAAWWAASMWGWRAGGLTAVLLAFEPNLLANGHLATTDVGYTLGLFLAMVCFLRFLERFSWGRLMAAALAFSLALLTRFNAVILVAVLPVLAVVVRRRLSVDHPLRHGRGVFRTAAVFIVMAGMVTWITYGFELRPLNQPQDETARQVLQGLGVPSSWMSTVNIPAASYLSGTLWQVAHSVDGQPAYLFGRASERGWWYYFPVAMAVKMTAASLLLGAASAFVIRRRQRDQGRSSVFSAATAVVPFVILTVASLLSHLDLGVRYVLPSIVLLVMLASGTAATLMNRNRFWSAAAVVLVVWHVVSVSRTYPHVLPYANEFFGGPARLYRILIDSNLDWGQDLPLLRRYLASQGITEYRFRSFSTAPAAAYGLVEQDPPSDEAVASKPFRGVIAVGVSWLYYPGIPLQWLRSRTPTAVLGHSINVYDLR